MSTEGGAEGPPACQGPDSQAGNGNLVCTLTTHRPGGAGPSAPAPASSPTKPRTRVQRENKELVARLVEELRPSDLEAALTSSLILCRSRTERNIPASR
jgi:hypothetical protein